MSVTRIIILGAGYAGLTAANRLARVRGTVITVVDPRDVFVDRIHLHELAAGSRASRAVVPFTRMLSAGVRTVRARATLIDAAARTVSLDSGERLEYDELVYAVGSDQRTDLVPGAERHAHHPASLEGATALRDAVAALPAGGHILVVGAGATGVEIASELASRREARVTIAHSHALLPGVSEPARIRAGSRLRRLGVTLVSDRVTSLDANGATLRSGGRIDADLTVWAGSFAVPTLARDSGLDVDATGRLRVDAGLRSVSDPHILGAGDACVVEGHPHLRMACATAIPMGAHAADTLIAGTREQPSVAFSLAYVMLCVSLGSRGGLIQLVKGDDSPRSLRLTGLAAATVKEVVCRFARGSIRLERVWRGSYRWAKLPAPSPAPQAQEWGHE